MLQIGTSMELKLEILDSRAWTGYLQEAPKCLAGGKAMMMVVRLFC